jgi:hypothetical protein
MMLCNNQNGPVAHRKTAPINTIGLRWLYDALRYAVALFLIRFFH